MRKNLLWILALSFLPIMLSAQVYDQSVTGNTSASTEEGEAHIAINPTDSNKMVMGFMSQSTGGLSFRVFQSSDAGSSWQASTLNTASYISSDFPGYVVIGGGDIVFAYDKSGKLYCSWIYLLADVGAANPYDSCIWTSYWSSSVDNGHTFTLANGDDHFFGKGKVGLTNGLEVHDYEDGICDRQWMAVDLTNGIYQNNLYVGYINYPHDMAQTGLKVKTKQDAQATFGSPVMAYPGNGQLTNIGVDSDGILHYTFANIMSNKVYHVSSSDGGQTFSSPHEIFSGVRMFPQGSTSINDRENAAPSFAIDGSNNLHLVWGDFPIGQQPMSYYAYSTDGGSTWSTAVDLSTFFGSKVFMPVVSAYGSRVTIGGHVLDNTDKAEYYIASSADHGQNFATPVKVSSGITDFDAVGGSVWVGDYSSSVRTGCQIYSLWTDCRANGCKQYIAKYDECNPTGIVELTPIESSMSLKNCYPVPTNGELNLILQSDITDQLIIEVFNSTGQKVKNEVLKLTTGEQKHQLQVDDLESGSYILRLTNTQGTFITRSFVKN